MLEPVQHNSKISTKWIENLALEEINMEEAGVINFNEHLNPEQFLEESSIQLMDRIRDLTEVYLNRFNNFRSNNSTNGQIKIFKLSNTINDFMLFRNSLRLIFARQANDLINIGFLTASGQFFAPRLSNHTEQTDGPHQIKAFIGPFNSISWKFQGDDINLDAMVRHYLTEFIRHSAR